LIDSREREDKLDDRFHETRVMELMI